MSANYCVNNPIQSILVGEFFANLHAYGLEFIQRWIFEPPQVICIHLGMPTEQSKH